MKLLTKEEEQAHYHATLRGGLTGGVLGLGIGSLGVFAASRRYQFFRQLTLPLKAFLITSGATFGGIIAADHASHAYERDRNPIDQEYRAREQRQAEAETAGKTFTERAMAFGKKERYKIVGASWVASMFAAFTIVNRNKFLSGQQKLVQARVYAQFLTVGVLVATAAFEISDSKNETGRYETIKVLDPNDPEHKRYVNRQRQVESSDGDTLWKEMVAAEEQRIKEREEDEERLRTSKHKKAQPKKKSNGDQKSNDDKDDKQSEKDKKDQKSDDSKKGDKNDGKGDEGSKDGKDKGKIDSKAEGQNKNNSKDKPQATDAKDKH